MKVETPYIDRKAFQSVRCYYFRDAVAKSWGLPAVVSNLSEARLSDLRPLYKAAHLLALDWHQRRYV